MVLDLEERAAVESINELLTVDTFSDCGYCNVPTHPYRSWFHTLKFRFILYKTKCVNVMHY
jgi:hypothetical protein